MFERFKLWRQRRKNRKDNFVVLKAQVMVPLEEMEQNRSIRVPVRCLDGEIVTTEKEIPVPVCKAIEALSYRLLAEHERFVDLSFQPRKKTGRAKVTALLGVMSTAPKTQKEGDDV